MRKHFFALSGAFLIVFGASSALAADITTRVLDAQGQPIAGAVVYFTSDAAKELVKPLPVAKVVQQNKTFVPDVLVVTRGTPVEFPNEDTVRHHVYSFSPVKKFEIKLYVGTPTEPVIFDKSGVALLGCNIHDTMVAWIVVVDTPYYAQTNEKGEALVKNLPAGNYQQNVWHKQMPVDAAAFGQPVALSSDAMLTIKLPEQPAQ